MGLFGRSGRARVEVTPAVVRPRQTVTATVSVDGRIDGVSAARLEWGYDNFYRYHWAGRADSAAAAGNDTLMMAGQVGTSYGSERDGDDWVCVTRVDVPIATAEFDSTTATFTVPSWAPGSSPVLARWGCRLIVERSGRDVDVRGAFTVVIGASDTTAAEQPMERVSGAGSTVIDVVVPAPLYRAGEAITGTVVLRPQQDLPNGDVAVYWQRERTFHPLERYPAQDSVLDGRIVQLDNRIPLRAGAEFGIGFELPLPPDAAPSGDSVATTVSWFVGARMFYAGFNAHMLERVRRPIVVVNAP